MKKLTKLCAIISAAVMLFSLASATGCGMDGVDGVNGTNGKDGTSVVSTSVDENGDLIVKFSDGTLANAGAVRGTDGTDGTDGKDGVDGKDGISVTDVYIDRNGDMIVTFSDGTKINAGNVKEPEKLYLNKVASFDTGFTDAEGGVAEIVKYNTDNGKMYLVNGKTKTLDIVTLGVYGKSELETVFNETTDRIYFNTITANHAADFESGFVVGDITSVSVNTELDLIAVALQHEDYDKAGAIVLLDYNGNYIKAYPCGVQPDMITFSGNLVLTADEGEPRLGYGADAVDPKGSVTVLDLSGGVTGGTVIVVSFDDFDAQRAALTQAGVLIKKGATPSVDFEPEYIAVSGNYAYVSLQEANAVATLDLETKAFISVLPLGFKDHSVEGNGLDLLSDGTTKIETQNVYGVYMPDGIDAFTVDGVTYIATANEGDAREWGDYSGVTKTTVNGYKVETLDNSEWDGIESDKIYILGGRSFSIFRASDMALVYDSGDMIECAVANSEYAAYFNCSNDDVAPDARSKKKGPEPETVVVRAIGDGLYAFVGLERVSGVVAFDITDFLDGVVKMANYTSTRDYSQAMAGDVAPEGMDFAFASEYTCGKNLLIVAYENSGTVALYAVENEQKTYEMHSTFHAVEAEDPDNGEEQPSSTLVIYSVYGSGGNTDGTVSHDYIAIKNISDAEINLTGYSVGYSSGGSAWQELALSGTVGAGQIYIIRCNAANVTGAVINIGDGNFGAEWALSMSNKAISVRLTYNGATVDALGIDADGVGTESGEGTVVSDMSKQKIVIRTSDEDTNDNSADFETVSFKGMTSDSATVQTYLSKLGINENTQ